MNKYPVFTDDYMNEYNQMSKEERKNCGAEWTPPEIISKMMGMVSDEEWAKPNDNMLDPTCGTGNIIVCMVLNKIYHGIDPTTAIEHVYGIELLPQNVKICRERLLKIVGNTAKHREIVKKNIVCSDFFLWNIEEWRPYTTKELKELAKTKKWYKRYV